MGAMITTCSIALLYNQWLNTIIKQPGEGLGLGAAIFQGLETKGNMNIVK